MASITNRTFDELSIGDFCIREHTVTEKDLILFAAVSGDLNPVHLDAAFAANTPFKGQIAHGMFTGALISAALAMQLPGPGSIYLGQNLAFKKPVKIDDQLTVKLTIADKHPKKPVVTLDCTVTNQKDEVVASGDATVLAPTEKVTIDTPDMPNVQIEQASEV